MKSKNLKNYAGLTGSGVGYQKSDYTAALDNSANTALSKKSGTTSFLGALGVNDLVFGIKDRDNEYAGIEAGHDLGLNAITEYSTILMYALIAAALVAVCYFYFRKK